MKKISKLFPIIIIFLVFYSAGEAQITANQSQKIDQLFSQYNNTNTPGCVVGVIDEGQLVYSKGFGMANLETRSPFTADTEFCVGSVSKQFTASCIGLLVQEGKVDLDEDIRTYLPELSNYNQGITVRHLLHHTSGIRDYSGLMALERKSYQRFTSYAETLPLLNRQTALNFPPNTQHLYSNSGYLLLQEIVRKVSGQSLQAFAAEQIFSPLNMSSTFYNADFERITSSSTRSYWKNKEGKFVPYKEQSVGVSNELIQTTLNDLLLWDQNFYHYQVGGKILIEMLQKPAILENGEPINYAFGLEVGTYKGTTYVTHGGGNLGYTCEFIRFPKHKKSVLVLSNHPNINPRTLVYKIANIILEKEFKNAPSTKVESLPIQALSSLELKKYCSPYWNTKINQPRYVYLENDTLRYNRPDNYESLLVPVGKHTFRMLNTYGKQTASSVRFVLNENGKNEMYFKVGDGPESYAYQFKEARYSKKDLKGFEGTFHSSEANVSYEATFMIGQLCLITDDKRRWRLSPIKSDYFIDSSNRKISFLRDQNKKIIGFTMDTPRVKGLLFEKIKP